MNLKFWQYLSFVLLIGIFALWGCPKKTQVTAMPEAQQTQAEKAPSPTPAPSMETTTPEAKHEVRSEGSNQKAGTMVEGLKPIYFDFDKSFKSISYRPNMRCFRHDIKRRKKVGSKKKIMLVI